MIQCRLCNLRYIGETKRRLKDRFDEHRRPVLNPTSNYIHIVVSQHFLSNNHSDTDMLPIPIDKLKNERDSSRKAGEAHVIHKAKTFEPLGINKRDEMYFVTTYSIFFGLFSIMSKPRHTRHICNFRSLFSCIYISVNS